MATKRYDVVWAERTEGREKPFWHRIGAVIHTEKGFSLKLTMIPSAWDGWAYLMEPDDGSKSKGEDDDASLQRERPSRARAPAKAAGRGNDPTPF